MGIKREEFKPLRKGIWLIDVELMPIVILRHCKLGLINHMKDLVGIAFNKLKRFHEAYTIN
jgi:hypothetical protein